MLKALTSWFEPILAELAATYRFRFVIQSFVKTTLKQRYRRSLLGFAWSLLSPLLNYGVTATVFSYSMRGGIPNYFAYMFSGAVFFSFMSTGLNQSPGIMIHNEAYIKKIYVPKLVFVLNIILTEFVNFAFSFAALAALGIAFGKIAFSLPLLSLPLLVLLALLFLIGLGLMLSIATIFFRDLSHITPVLMQASFFLTPILYEKSFLPEKFQHLLYFNPFYYFVECFRAPIYSQAWPAKENLGMAALLATVSLVAGLLTLKRFDNKIIFKL